MSRLFEENLDDGYESPIIIFEDVARQIAENTDKAVLKAIGEVGITVKKDELIQALQYDRGQYKKGYENGLCAGVKKAIDTLQQMLEEDEEGLT